MTEINIDGKMLKNLGFTEDIVPIANDLRNDVMFNGLSQVTKEVVVKINESKTNFITNFGIGGIIKFQNITIKEVTQDRYFGLQQIYIHTRNIKKTWSSLAGILQIREHLQL